MEESVEGYVSIINKLEIKSKLEIDPLEYYKIMYGQYKQFLDELGFFDLKTYGKEYHRYFDENEELIIPEHLISTLGVDWSSMSSSDGDAKALKILTSRAEIYRKVCEYLKNKVFSTDDIPLAKQLSINEVVKSTYSNCVQDIIAEFSNSSRETLYMLPFALHALGMLSSFPMKDGMQTTWFKICKYSFGFVKGSRTYTKGLVNYGNKLELGNEKAISKLTDITDKISVIVNKNKM